MRSLFRVLTVGIGIAFVVGACGGSTTTAPGTAAPAASVAATLVAGGFNEAAEEKKLYDAATAANETEVNLYSSINEEEAKPLLDMWAARFPRIKANYIRASEAALVSRILTEAQAGKNNFDVVATTTSQIIASAGLALQYFPPNVVAQVKDDYRDKAGFWFSIYTNWDVVQINTNKVKKGDIKTYEDLLKPQFKGQIVIDDSDVEFYQGLIAARGQDKADELIRNIVKTNGVTVIDGHGTVSDKVVAGEFAVALNNYVNQAERAKRQGAPTDWIAIEPVTVITAGKVVTAKSAPHPNAAKLMSNFLASSDAQKYLASRGRQITRSDVPQDPPDLLKGITKTYTAPVLTAADQEAIQKKFKSLFK
jgi:iron(III) transport system substrate-binding protein